MFRNSRISVLLFVLLALLMSAIWAGTVSAQEATPEAVVEVAEPVTPIIVQPGPLVSDQGALYLAGAAVMLGILAVFTLVARPLILQLGSSAPAFLVEAGLTASDSLLDSAESYVKATPVAYDDALMTELRQAYESLAREIRQLRQDLPSANG